jgi:hypothetical protein
MKYLPFLAFLLLSSQSNVVWGQVNTYDFSSIYTSSTSSTGLTETPLTLGIATFTSPIDPGAFTVGPNGGLYSTLGSYVLSSAGYAEELDISFSIPQTAVSFDFGTGDFFDLNGGDLLTVTTNTGDLLTTRASLQDGDFFTSGSFSYSSSTAFSSITINASDSSGPESLAIADLTSTNAAAAPEPAAWALCLGGLAFLAFSRFGFRRINS